MLHVSPWVLAPRDPSAGVTITAKAQIRMIDAFILIPALRKYN
jgi:hypothetical protein